MQENGQIIQETGVRFERLLPGPIERVWNHLTESEHLAGWFGAGAIEPRVGGEVNFMEGHIRGVVTQWKPPQLLIYSWNVFSPGETESSFPESYLMFELSPRGNEILLTLTHRPMLADFEAQTLMGWHTFLEMFESLLRGKQPEPRETIMERNQMRYGVKEIKRV